MSDLFGYLIIFFLLYILGSLALHKLGLGAGVDWEAKVTLVIWVVMVALILGFFHWALSSVSENSRMGSMRRSQYGRCQALGYNPGQCLEILGRED